MSLASSAPSCGAPKQRGFHARSHARSSPLRLQRSTYLIQSVKKACILTDSKPRVQAYEKLCRGEFSASPRVSTFLSVVSRYQASFRHVSGAAILPSDFASRNAAACENETCQVCSFISRTRDSVVRAVSGQDILQGNVRLSFPLPAGPPGWLFSLSAQIYAAPTLTSSRVRDRPKSSKTSRTSNVI